MRTAFTLILLALLPSLSGFGASAVKCVDLRCEFLTDPVGVEATQPRLTWRLETHERGQKQVAYRILVASSLEKLSANEGDLWDSGRVKENGFIYFEYGWAAPVPDPKEPGAAKPPAAAQPKPLFKGKPLQSGQEVFWKVMVWDKDDVETAWSEPARFTVALLEDTDWKADWISFRDPAALPRTPNSLHLPAPRYYRKPFGVTKKVKRALAFATALGIYELHLNGKKVGDAYFAPGWTDYNGRVYYNTYDLTARLQEGQNCVGAIVADGWYAGYLGTGKNAGTGPNKSGRNFYGKTPALSVQIQIEYDDGSTELLLTDPTWEVATGPESEADLRMGESYDATKEIPGWATADFNSSGWQNAVLAESNPKTRALFTDKAGRTSVQVGFTKPSLMEAYPAEPIRVTQELAAKKLSSPKPNTWIFDFGQNITGNVRLKIKGNKGQKLTLRYGEWLHQDGQLVTESLRKARATDTYICKGDPEGEIWTPRFTIHGFQFAEITGLKEEPSLETLTGLVIHNDLRFTSGFECSDPIVTKLFQNCIWTQRGNMVELPTNSPRIDDRMGSTGEAQISIRAACFHMDARAFYDKWMRELQEARTTEGFYPTYAPYPFANDKFAHATGWSDAGIISPYVLWWMHGHHQVIKPRWFALTGFMDARRQLDLGLKGTKFGASLGDLRNIDDPTPREFLDLCYLALDCRLMMEMARVSTGPVSFIKYRTWFGQILASFKDQYIAEDGSLKVKSQSAHALALRFGLVPAEHREKVTKTLLGLIESKKSDTNSGMTTGLLGTTPLLQVLSWANHHDEAVRLLQSRKYPSWGYAVENGASTVWERPDAYSKDHGFKGVDGKQTPSSNSFSDPAAAAVSEWMLSMLAGIENLNAGFKLIRLEPRVPSADATDEAEPINWVRAHYDSVHGRVAVHWKRLTGDGLLYEATVPPNTFAMLKLPAKEGAAVTESGQPVGEAKGVREDDSKKSPTHRNFVLEPGSYRFEVK